MGALVEVRSASEVLATLDPDGKLDGLPFMPEMLQYCGRRFRVFKSAHKTCDTINKTGARRMDRAVHLENLRCDGAAHGGCQAGCLLFWKEAWLRHIEEPEAARDARWRSRRRAAPMRRSIGRHDTRAPSPDDEAFACQATELFRATAPLRW